MGFAAAVVPGALDVDVCAGAKLAALKATIRIVVSFTSSFPSVFAWLRTRTAMQ
jgi:hypothetical protein